MTTTVIRQLPSNVIDKIAAGEVVERPASVVKELVENSIDAGSTIVDVSIEEGGCKSICVVDNGVGMSFENVNKCYHRHATSKMFSPSDLFNVKTLGFRGEALSSIGAVSIMSIDTRSKTDKEGTRLVIEGGIERECKPVGRSLGTSVTVKQLFFNTPARRKFLRKVDTEARHVSRIMIHLSAAYPEVGFTLEHNNRHVMRLPPSNHLERSIDLLGVQKDDITLINKKIDGIHFHCSLAHDSSKVRGKGRQYLMVRKRPIQSRGIVDAIYHGCGNFLLEDQHPSFLAWLELDPKRIDVNVHPAKREIRISEERSICEFIVQAIRDAILPSDIKKFQFNTTGDSKPIAQPVNMSALIDKPNDNRSESVNQDSETKNFSSLSNLSTLPDVKQSSIPDLIRTEGDSTAFGPSKSVEQLKNELIQGNYWQAYNTYILCQFSDGLLVIDQTAAHERIIFEMAMENAIREDIIPQQLLLPIVEKLSREEYQLAIFYKEILKSIGFIVEEFGENTVAIQSIPNEIKEGKEKDVLVAILGDLENDGKLDDIGAENVERMRIVLAKSFGKHSSVNKDTKLEPDEMAHIVSSLMECDDPFFSPEGNATMAKILRRDFDRLFGK